MRLGPPLRRQASGGIDDLGLTGASDLGGELIVDGEGEICGHLPEGVELEPGPYGMGL